MGCRRYTGYNVNGYCAFIYNCQNKGLRSPSPPRALHFCSYFPYRITAVVKLFGQPGGYELQIRMSQATACIIRDIGSLSEDGRREWIFRHGCVQYHFWEDGNKPMWFLWIISSLTYERNEKVVLLENNSASFLTRDASHLHRLLVKVIYLLPQKVIFNYFKAFAKTVGLHIMLA